MIHRVCLKTGLIRFAAITFLLTSMAATSASLAAARYSGVSLTTLGVDTTAVNSVIDPGGKVNPSERVVLIGVEGLAGEYNGWIFGGFGYKGRVATSKTDTFHTELGITLGGVSMETVLQNTGRTEYMAGVRAGGGKYTLDFTNVNAEQQVDSLPDAAMTPLSTSVSSPFWFFEPSIGMRARLTELLIFDAKVGYSLSMSNGEWRYGAKLIDTANIKLAGPSITIGLKLGAF